jgi:zinc protease
MNSTRTRLLLAITLAMLLVALGATIAVRPLHAAGGGYHEEVLDNGLRVILVEHHANPMVCFSTVVSAGVVHEPPGMNGSSHFLEHLLFNGTTTRTQRELYDEVDLYGAYNNATTREDHTLYMMLIQKEFAEQGLDLQADMLLNSIVPNEKFEKEKGIVLEELAQDKSRPGYMVTRSFREFAYDGTPAARSVLGTEESISNLERDDVWEYYKSRYVPRNMTVVVMGDFNIPEMLGLVKGKFGKAEGGKPSAPVMASWPEAPAPNSRVINNDESRIYLNVALPLPWTRHDERTLAVDLLLQALSEGDDSPLGRQLRGGDKPLALNYGVSVMPREGHGSSVELSATMETGTDPALVLAQMAAGLQSLGRGTVARERVDAVRRSQRTSEVLLADQIHYYAMMNSSWIHGSPEGYLRDRVQVLDGIGEDVLDEASATLTAASSEARIMVAGPDWEDASHPWEVPAPPAEAGGDRAASIFRNLDNGAEVVFRRDDDSRVFALHLMFSPRSAEEPEGKEGIADLLHRIYLRGSIMTDSEGLAERTEQLGATLKAHDLAMIPFDDYYSRPEFSFVRLEMPVARWREGVALLSELVRFPRLESADMEIARRELLDVLKKKGDSPRTLASRAMTGLLAPGSSSAANIYGSPESVGSITLQDLASFHGRYAVGNHMVISGVGPVDPEELFRALNRGLGLLPSGAAKAPDGAPKAAPASVTEPGLREEIDLGKEQSWINMAYLFEAAPEDRPALVIAGSLMSDKLAFTVREEQGLAYRLGCSFGTMEGLTRFQIGIGTRPENIAKAQASIMEVLEGFQKGKWIAEADVEKTVNAVRGRQIMRRMSRVNQAYFLGMDRLAGDEPGASLARTNLLLEVGVEDVKRVLKHYLDPGKLAVVVVR